MASVSPAEMLTVYGLTLMIIGALAYQAAPPTAKAMSSVYMGNGGAVVCFLLAVGARDVTLEKCQPGYIPMMISVHLAFIFPILYATAVSWRLVLAWNIPTKAYLRPYLFVIIGMSLVTAAVVYASKPNNKSQKSSDTAQITTDQQQDASRSGDTAVRGETVIQRRRGATT